MKGNTFRRVLVIGAGTMRQHIAWQCVMRGHEAWLHDAVAKVFDNAWRRPINYSARLIIQGIIAPEQTN